MRSLVSSLSSFNIALLKALLWGVLSILSIWLCLGIGLGEWQRPDLIDPTIWELRWPRVVVALIVGAALAVAGATMQALFANPLADPSLIGTSSGAALGAMLACGLVLIIHHLLNAGRFGLLIIGFALSAFCGAVVSLILFMSNDMVLRSATTWLSGTLSSAGFVPISYALVTILFGFIILLPLGRALDILLLGDEIACTMGIHVTKVRIFTVIGTAFLTGAAVSLSSGIIGFLGMMIPNVVAKFWGGTRSSIMWKSAGIGALFLLIVDTCARHIVYPIDLLVGIVISLLGAPFFI